VEHPLLCIVRSQKAGVPAGCPSICNALPIVLEASLAEASQAGTLALIESTSNQVNQFGGYTGMRPLDFRRLVSTAAARTGLPPGLEALVVDRVRDVVRTYTFAVS